MKLKTYLLLAAQFGCFSLAFAQQQTVKTFQVESNYLQIPIKNGGKMQTVSIRNAAGEIRNFQAEVADGKADWYAYLDVRKWKGEQLSVFLDTKDVAAWKDQFKLSNIDSNANQYQEKQRGQLHFSPKRGWMNDPNGMVFYNGEYHLFYQHNPYGVNWGNMHWGHAVSKDLIHWKELDEALYPDEYGTMFSGGGVVDVPKTSEFSKGGNPAMLLYYTAAEKSWTQGLAYSQDGRNFTKLDKPIVQKITDGNRDPKVIWYAPGKHWVMVFYVEDAGEQHSFYFYTSKDMKNWEFTSKLLGGIRHDRYLFECPELFELPVEGSQEKKWVLTGANSQYAIGTFDGKTFKPEEERIFSQQGRDFYAAQTFSDEPQGRRVEIGWWRTHTGGHGSSFNQSMSIPMELKLRKTDRGIRLYRKPVEELKSLRSGTQKIANLTLNSSAKNPLQDFQSETAEIRFTLKPSNAKNLQLNVRGLDIHYQINEQELVIDNVRAHVPLKKEGQEFIIYVDRIGVEVFTAGGEVFMPINYNLDSKNLNYSLKIHGGQAEIQNLETHSLKSIWK